MEPISDDDDFETRAARFPEWGHHAKRPNQPDPDLNGNGDQPTSPPTPGAANPAYLRGAVELAARELAAMPKDSGRNHQLNREAWKLAHYKDIQEHDAKAALMHACAINGLLAEDGSDQCKASFDSGWKKGRKESPWNVPESSCHSDNIVWFDPPPLDDINASTSVHDLDPRPFEQDFWQRESLARIYDCALGRMVAPWAVLAYCIARALALVAPRITLASGIGSRGSLNWFAAIVSASGGGKTIASDLAAELVENVPNVRNLGSGEGIVGQFYRPATKTEEAVRRESIMFVADEGDTVSALEARNASTTMSVLRSAFSGGTLGFSYITRGRDIHIPAHSYRMTMVINIQPSGAGPLMYDMGGTPQRFAFFPGNDPRFSFDIPDVPWINSLNLPPTTSWQTRTLNVPEEVRVAMKSDRIMRARGGGDPLDGHLLFWRAKFAFGLAVLDGRVDITLEDWRLAGIAAGVSCATRTWLLTELDKTERNAAYKRGTLQGVALAESAVEKEFQTRQKLNRVAQWTEGKLREAGQEGLTKRELARKCSSRDRGMLEQALGGLVEWGRISFDASQKRWTYVKS